MTAVILDSWKNTSQEVRTVRTRHGEIRADPDDTVFTMSDKTAVAVKPEDVAAFIAANSGE